MGDDHSNDNTEQVIDHSGSVLTVDAPRPSGGALPGGNDSYADESEELEPVDNSIEAQIKSHLAAQLNGTAGSSQGEDDHEGEDEDAADKINDQAEDQAEDQADDAADDKGDGMTFEETPGPESFAEAVTEAESAINFKDLSLPDMVDEWSQILQKFPVGESYVVTHPGVEFTAFSLALAQYRSEENKSAAHTLESVIEGLPAEAGLYGMDKKAVAMLQAEAEKTGNDVLMQINRKGYERDAVVTAAYGPVGGGGGASNQEKWEAYQLLKTNPDATVRELKEFYADAVKVVYVNPLRSTGGMIDSVLEDVRRGRASDQS